MNFLKTQQNLSALCHKQAANSFFISLLLLLLLAPFNSYAKDAKSLEQILELRKKPIGIVIEIVTWGGDNLEWALPRAKDYIKKLRKKFSNLPVAIVTHGAEQFSLTNDNKEDKKEIHSLVKSLGNDDVPIHVCETFAGWRGLTAEDFPDYVNVAAAGPAQVNDYISLGYELIVITEE